VIRVLLVDDHPLFREGVKRLLDAEGDLTVVAEAGTGPEAVQIARETPLDVIIMDVSLPQLSGAEATREILAANPAQRVLVLSAHEEVTFARQLLGVGAAGYALKRSACDELVRALRVVASGRTYLDPALRRAFGPPSNHRRSPGDPLAPSLSVREAEVIRLISRGLSSKEVAEQLGISARTLETYKTRAMAKLDLRSRADIMSYAVRCGLLRDA
jgi:DNA-binding NarL/FixJ family response regulator